MPNKKFSFKRFFKALGPGFITGAADDDPSGIATYSQTGAQFGYGQLWIALFSYPFMVTVQEMCGRIGLVTGKGLSGVIKEHYSRKVLYSAVLLLLVANTINIGADLGAMAASVQLVFDIPFAVLLIGITVFTILLEVLVPYPVYAKYLKYLTFSLVAYIITAFVVGPDWWLVARSVFVPHIIFTKQYLFNIAALLGTTISPYLFFWQADEEVEEEIVNHKIRGIGQGAPKINASDITQMRLDTFLGMFFSNLVTFFVILTVASTLSVANIHQIKTAADAAEALRPFAGDFAFLLFALGILGTGLLAVPVLAGSAAYAVSEAFNWNAGLGKRFRQAHGFYGVITIATLIGLLINFTSIGSMTVLYYAAILNGVLAPPLLILILLIGNNKKILGKNTNSAFSNYLGITITAIMSLIALALFVNLASANF
ncbi:MAG: divalent metal cation transporter [Candidatus Niyogibacteria bacterium]|nr:divalent metal cation transporter [Candidatus Niyogibacteria bacterium]